MNKWRQLESTVATGITAGGTGTRLIRWLLSNSDVVPDAQEMVKKLNGTRPQRTNSGKSWTPRFGKMCVKMKVNTPIMTMGFSRDQNTPKDMLR